MSGMTKFVALAFVVLVLGGGVFLLTWDIPAPSEPVTKTLDNDRFPS